MTEDEANLWCKQRKIDIYRWFDRTNERDMYNLTGWMENRRSQRVRIHIVDASLLGAVTQIQAKIAEAFVV